MIFVQKLQKDHKKKSNSLNDFLCKAKDMGMMKFLKLVTTPINGSDGSSGGNSASAPLFSLFFSILSPKNHFFSRKKTSQKKSHCSILSSLTMQERVSFSKTGSKILRHSLLLCLPLRQTYKFTKKREVNSWTVINKRFLDQKFLFRTVS